jgi:hypothetical protein
MPQIKITLPPAVLAFWDARLDNMTMSRSEWLKNLLLTWNDTNQDPLVRSIGRDGLPQRVQSHGGARIPDEQAAAARAQIIEEPLPVQYHRSYKKACQAFKEAMAAYEAAKRDLNTPRGKLARLHNLAAAQQAAITECTED